MKKNNNLLKLSKALKYNFKQLKIKKYSNAFIASDISCLSKLRLRKDDISETIFNSIKSSLSKDATIFVPTGKH